MSRLYRLCLPHRSQEGYDQPTSEEFDALHYTFASEVYRQDYREVCSRSFTREEAVEALREAMDLSASEASRRFMRLSSPRNLVWTQGRQALIGHHARI